MKAGYILMGKMAKSAMYKQAKKKMKSTEVKENIAGLLLFSGKRIGKMAHIVTA